METPALRPFVSADIPAALALWQSCTGIGLNDSDSPDALREFLLRNPGCSFVAIRDGRLIGAVLGGHDGRRAFLYHLAVAAPYRGRGIGSQLVAECLARFARLRLTRVTIHLFADNDEGKAFWHSTRWRDRGDLVVLQRELPPPQPTAP